jgi:hypothetical protein
MLCFIAWMPALACHGRSFLDQAGDHRYHDEIEQLNLRGLFLVGIGFSLQALGTVLS